MGKKERKKKKMKKSNIVGVDNPQLLLVMCAGRGMIARPFNALPYSLTPKNFSFFLLLLIYIFFYSARKFLLFYYKQRRTKDENQRDSSFLDTHVIELLDESGQTSYLSAIKNSQ